MHGDTVSVERTIAAPAATIFALLADPARHHELDGSGTVTGTRSSTPVRAVGDRFTMDMRLGLPYRMVSTVVEYEQDRRIAWQPFPDIPLVGTLVGGRIWRYELEPVDDATLVRETWDVSQERMGPLVKLGGIPAKTERAMARTLERIERLLT